MTMTQINDVNDSYQEHESDQDENDEDLDEVGSSIIQNDSIRVQINHEIIDGTHFKHVAGDSNYDAGDSNHDASIYRLKIVY